MVLSTLFPGAAGCYESTEALTYATADGQQRISAFPLGSTPDAPVSRLNRSKDINGSSHVEVKHEKAADLLVIVLF